jgi:hypothetical protein
MINFLRRKKDNRVFAVKPRKGKTMSQSLDRGKDVPLPTKDLRKIAQERGIDIDTDTTRNVKEGVLVSLHPSNRELDNIVVKEGSPHVHDEVDLNTNEELRQEQNRMVAEAKGLRTDEDEATEVQEDIAKQREKDQKEKEKEK